MVLVRHDVAPPDEAGQDVEGLPAGREVRGGGGALWRGLLRHGDLDRFHHGRGLRGLGRRPLALADRQRGGVGADGGPDGPADMVEARDVGEAGDAELAEPRSHPGDDVTRRAQASRRVRDSDLPRLHRETVPHVP